VSWGLGPIGAVNPGARWADTTHRKRSHKAAGNQETPLTASVTGAGASTPQARPDGGTLQKLPSTRGGGGRSTGLGRGADGHLAEVLHVHEVGERYRHRPPVACPVHWGHAPPCPPPPPTAPAANRGLGRGWGKGRPHNAGQMSATELIGCIQYTAPHTIPLSPKRGGSPWMGPVCRDQHLLVDTPVPWQTLQIWGRAWV